MKFKTIAEAFNHYRTSTLEEIERRAAEIKNIVATDAKADVDALNIELEGLAQAKQNVQSRAASGQQNSFNPVAGAGMTFERRASYEATEGDVFNSAEYRSAFMKRLLGRKLNSFEEAAFNRAMNEQRADAYATSGSVAAVLPTQTLNEVISKARTMGGIMSVCRSFNVPSKIAIPVGTPAAAASWHTEGAAVDSETPSVATVSFDGYEIMKVLSISVKVQAMSIAAFESYLVEELTNCVMACIADGLVNGTGTAQGTGILKGVATLLMIDKDTGKRCVAQMYWIPEETLEKRVTEEKIPYDKWRDRGLLRTCAGNTINYKDVTAWFLEMAAEYKIVPAWVYYDAWSARYWVEEMKASGFNMIPCIQGAKTLSLPMQNMGADLQAKRIVYNNHPILKWCLTNTGVKTDVNGNIVPVKNQAAKQRIDGMASLLDAYVGLTEKYEEYIRTL